MKRASIVATALLFSAALFAQVHGVPASVTSFGPGRGMAPGVPASVTSLGPHGYSSGGCAQSGCGNAYFFYPIGTTPATIAQPTHAGHHRPGGGHHGYNGAYYGGGYVYAPYVYPVPVVVQPEEEQQPEEPEPPAPTVFEHRPTVQPAPYVAPRPAAEAVQPASSEPAHHNMSPVSEEKIPVVVVYKDGHQREIPNGNYAIVGDMLYDLSGPIARKIKLADVNLQQTIELNEQRGVEFNVPASYKPQA